MVFLRKTTSISHLSIKEVHETKSEVADILSDVLILNHGCCTKFDMFLLSLFAFFNPNFCAENQRFCFVFGS